MECRAVSDHHLELRYGERHCYHYDANPKQGAQIGAISVFPSIMNFTFSP